METVSSRVYICETHDDAARAIINLKCKGVDMRTLSVIAKDMALGDPDGFFYTQGTKPSPLPTLDHLMVNGTVASRLTAAFRNVCDLEEDEVFCAGLSMLKIPTDRLHSYEAALAQYKLPLIVHGPYSKLHTAMELIGGITHGSHTVRGEKVSDVGYVAQKYPYLVQ